MKHLCSEVRKCRLEDTLIDRLKPTLTSLPNVVEVKEEIKHTEVNRFHYLQLLTHSFTTQTAISISKAI